jgi:oligopeptide/dipeptide ABC transporter ATP-binding protein
MSEIILEVKNLRTHFKVAGNRVAKAVDGISYHVHKGETVALVGESGCGKSVSAFSVMQLLPRNAIHPTGEILFKGMDILKMDVDERRALRGNQMSIIFQEPGTSLNPVFKTGAQVAEVLRLHEGMNKAQAREETIKIFGQVGIPNPSARYDAYPHEMSGGMKQRVMIAMALACKPDLLIADEPTTALDVTIQAQILQLIRDLQRERNMAVLMITHNLRVVNQVADRVMVMYAGKIVEKADRLDLFKNPQHPYTKLLLKSIPGEEARGKPLEEIPGRVPPATAFPDHCRFADRCPNCFEPCRETEPLLLDVADRHAAACHLFEREEVNADG